MRKNLKYTFYKAEYIQYNTILEDKEIYSMISVFLLKYVSLEAFYKKLLIAEKESSGNKLTNRERRNLRVVSSEVDRVFKYFDITCDEKLIDRVFGSNDSNYMDCSIKKLRDRLVHNVNDNVIRVIIERYDDINNDLDELKQILSK